ncbi:MAG TPA: PDZ domain-containing protein [Chitinophagaceae bacterium]|nr:PDZ domain-containing protein [Chitinophagaceae bacterium]
MKQNWVRTAILATALALLVPFSLIAQEKEKTDKADKEKKEKSEVQHITITKKGDKKEKIVVEIEGDKVTINGKPLEEYKDKDGDIKVNLHSLRDLESLTYFKTPKAGGWNINNDGKDAFTLFGADENRAMLGVTTESATEGAQIESVTKGSAAEKAGLKENDIITKIGDKKIENPDDLSEAIKKQKPGDKVDIVYLREKKEQKASVELSKWKGVGAYSFTPGQNFKLDMGDIRPKIHVTPDVKAPFEEYRTYARSGAPKLGLSVQDTDDGKGVKVIEVDSEGNAAKAGIKENDIITQLDDKPINNVDEISKMLKEKKDNPTVRFQLNRSGKSQNIEVKMPRKIKTAGL